MKFTRLLLPFALILSSLPAAADTLTDLLPPDTKVVFGIRVHNLVFSSVAQSFAAQAQEAAAGWLKAVPLDGVNLLRDVDEVLIATGMGPNSGALIVVTGRFDLARLAEGARIYHNVPLLGGENEGESAVALLDAGTALIGNPTLVHAAIDRRGGKSKIDPALNDRITSLRQRYDIWGLGAGPQGLPAPVPEAKVLEAIDRFQFGMQLANGLEVSAELHARSAKDEEKLQTVLDGIAAFLKAPKFDLQADGRTLKLTVSMPEADLQQAIEAQAAMRAPAAVTAVAPATAPEAPENGPNATPEPAPATAPAPVASATPAPSAKPKPADPHDTVVLMLPGKK
jgi:hypothetical protein